MLLVVHVAVGKSMTTQGAPTLALAKKSGRRRCSTRRQYRRKRGTSMSLLWRSFGVDYDCYFKGEIHSFIGTSWCMFMDSGFGSVPLSLSLNTQHRTTDPKYMHNRRIVQTFPPYSLLRAVSSFPAISLSSTSSLFPAISISPPYLCFPPYLCHVPCHFQHQSGDGSGRRQ